MPALVTKSFETPDETRTPDKTRVAMVDLGGGQGSPFTIQPGWHWSECIKPVADTQTGQTRHVSAVVSGRRHLTHVDGTELDIGADDAHVIKPGHDTWVTSEESFVTDKFDSATAETFPQPARLSSPDQGD